MPFAACEIVHSAVVIAHLMFCSCRPMFMAPQPACATIGAVCGVPHSVCCSVEWFVMICFVSVRCASRGVQCDPRDVQCDLGGVQFNSSGVWRVSCGVVNASCDHRLSSCCVWHRAIVVCDCSFAVGDDPGVVRRGSTSVSRAPVAVWNRPFTPSLTLFRPSLTSRVVHLPLFDSHPASSNAGHTSRRRRLASTSSRSALTKP